MIQHHASRIGAFGQFFDGFDPPPSAESLRDILRTSPMQGPDPDEYALHLGEEAAITWRRRNSHQGCIMDRRFS